MYVNVCVCVLRKRACVGAANLEKTEQQRKQDRGEAGRFERRSHSHAHSLRTARRHCLQRNGVSGPHLPPFLITLLLGSIRLESRDQSLRVVIKENCFKFVIDTKQSIENGQF